MVDVVTAWYVFKERELSDLLKTLNYRLMHRSNFFYPMHNFKNYDFPYSEIEHTNLVHEKNNNDRSGWIPL